VPLIDGGTLDYPAGNADLAIFRLDWTHPARYSPLTTEKNKTGTEKLSIGSTLQWKPVLTFTLRFKLQKVHNVHNCHFIEKVTGSHICLNAIRNKPKSLRSKDLCILRSSYSVITEGITVVIHCKTEVLTVKGLMTFYMQLTLHTAVVL
jgi:hypothetical protein